MDHTHIFKITKCRQDIIPQYLYRPNEDYLEEYVDDRVYEFENEWVEARLIDQDDDIAVYADEDHIGYVMKKDRSDIDRLRPWVENIEVELYGGRYKTPVYDDFALQKRAKSGENKYHATLYITTSD